MSNTDNTAAPARNADDLAFEAWARKELPFCFDHEASGGRADDGAKLVLLSARKAWHESVRHRTHVPFGSGVAAVSVDVDFTTRRWTFEIPADARVGGGLHFITTLATRNAALDGPSR